MSHQELIVFLPAVGGDSSFWSFQVKEFSRSFDVLAYDFHRPAKEVSMANFADDVADAILRKGHLKAHIVGLSMGGVVAQELFRRHPERVRSLTLANSWAHLADGKNRLEWVTRELSSRTLPEFSRASLPRLFAPTTKKDIIDMAVAVESAKDKDVYHACWKDMLLIDQRDLFSCLNVPLLLIGGALDGITPTDPCLTMIQEGVSMAQLVNIPTASHFSNLDEPEYFTATLRSFLRSTTNGEDGRLSSPETEKKILPEGSTAEQFLRLLFLRKVDLFVSNSGTDFTPLIDALAKLSDEESFKMKVVVAPHENTAVAIAHGHTLLSRRPQVVMGHVGVGTANMGLGIMNAKRARIPMLVLAGKTPHYEKGLPGVRTNFVQWGQDTFDQGAYFREFTKWDYELKGPHALDTVIDRAMAIAESDPRGPVYLTLPKEPLCQMAPARTVDEEGRIKCAKAGVPSLSSLEKAAHWIKTARNPLIITADLGRHAGGPHALVTFAQNAGAGVVEHGKRNFFNFPTEHPQHLGFDPLPHLGSTDLIIAIDCPVPWIPSLGGPQTSPPMIQIGTDPLFSDIPMRGFPSDLTLSGDPVETLKGLSSLLEREDRGENKEKLKVIHENLFSKARSIAKADGKGGRITKAFLSYAIGEAIDDDVVIFNEYNLDPMLVPRKRADSWFENSVASGLGWSLGAAIGGKIAAPEKTVVVTLGDGAYLFNTPVSAHLVVSTEELPILIIVFNDSAWTTIKKSTKESHPDGHAVKSGKFPLCEFDRTIDFEKIAEATGGIGIRAESAEELPARLREGLSLVRSGRRHVLINVICERD